MNRRGVFSLLLGSAAVVGFKTTFGFDDWRGFEPPPKRTFLQPGHVSVDPVFLVADDFNGGSIDLSVGARNYADKFKILRL